MRKRLGMVVVALAGLVLLGACGSGNEATDVAAPGSQNASGDAVKAVDPGCGWASDLAPKPTDGTTPAKELTQADIDKAVAGSPKEIKEDTRVLMEASLKMQELGKQIEGLPPEQAAQKSMETLAVMNSPEYGAAFTNIMEYIKVQCPGLAKQMQDAIDAMNAMTGAETGE